MFALVSSEKIHLPAGAVVRLPATWQEYRTLCQQRGDAALPRLKYRLGEVLFMAPRPRHGRDASLIADIIKTLLDHLGREYDAFTPITMELPEASGIEPDYCFYIDHWQAVSGKERIDWRLDPPADLVLEIDVTSYSDVDDYLPYRVPEVWLFRNNALVIYRLQGEEYVAGTASRYMLESNLSEIIAQCLHVAYERNTSAAIRDLQQRLGAEPRHQRQDYARRRSLPTFFAATLCGQKPPLQEGLTTPDSSRDALTMWRAWPWPTRVIVTPLCAASLPEPHAPKAPSSLPVPRCYHG